MSIYIRCWLDFALTNNLKCHIALLLHSSMSLFIQIPFYFNKSITFFLFAVYIFKLWQQVFLEFTFTYVHVSLCVCVWGGIGTYIVQKMVSEPLELELQAMKCGYCWPNSDSLEEQQIFLIVLPPDLKKNFRGHFKGHRLLPFFFLS